MRRGGTGAEALRPGRGRATTTPGRAGGPVKPATPATPSAPRTTRVAATTAAAVPSGPGPATASPSGCVATPNLLDAFEALLARRRTDRTIGPAPIAHDLLMRLLWAAQGITDAEGRRTTPSAGGRHPLEVLLVTPAGVHRYLPETREIDLIRSADRRGQLAGAALAQDVISRAPATLVITAMYARTEARFGTNRGPRYVQMEAGHACQNVLLEATALDLAAVPIGSFDDRRCQLALGLSHDERPLYLIPVGTPAQPAVTNPA